MTMSHPYFPPPPPAPRPPDTRPLVERRRVWFGGLTLFVIGVVVGVEAVNDKPAGAEALAAPAATTTVTAAPEPGPTVTETVKAKAKPRPTVTVRVTKTVKAADTSSGSGSSSGGGSTGTCSIVSSSGNCYSVGQFCRNSDHGASTTTAAGTRITCRYSSNAWRWTYS